MKNTRITQACLTTWNKLKMWFINWMKRKKTFPKWSSKSKTKDEPEKFPALKFVEIEPKSPEHFSEARRIVSASAIKRRSEQSVNFGSIFTAFVGVFIIGGWFYLLQAQSVKKAEQLSIRQTERAQLVNPATAPGQADNFSMYQFLSTVTPQPFTTATPSPTLTPQITVTNTPIYSVNILFKYSYYNPALGGVNCFTWDAVKNDCVSMMANGEDWHNQYGRVVACAPEIVLGSVIEITYPDALKGYWTCKDRGGMITGSWIDFLDITQRYGWGEPVSGILYPPNIPLDEIAKGTH